MPKSKIFRLDVDVTDALAISKAQQKLDYYMKQLAGTHLPREHGKVTRVEMIEFSHVVGHSDTTAGRAFKLLLNRAVAQAVEEKRLDRFGPGTTAFKKQILASKRSLDISLLNIDYEGEHYPMVVRFLILFLEAHQYPVPEWLKAQQHRFG